MQLPCVFLFLALAPSLFSAASTPALIRTAKKHNKTGVVATVTLDSAGEMTTASASESADMKSARDLYDALDPEDDATDGTVQEPVLLAAIAERIDTMDNGELRTVAHALGEHFGRTLLAADASSSRAAVIELMRDQPNSESLIEQDTSGSRRRGKKRKNTRRRRAPAPPPPPSPPRRRSLSGKEQCRQNEYGRDSKGCAGICWCQQGSKCYFPSTRQSSCVGIVSERSSACIRANCEWLRR